MRSGSMSSYIQARTIFLVVLSPDALDSTWVNDEIDIAWRRKNHPDPASRMRLIPVLHRSCTIRTDLESLQIVSFLPPKSYEAALQDILIALGLPSQPASSQKTPPAPWNLPAANVGSQLTIAPPPRTLAARPEAIEVLHTLTGNTSIVDSVALSADRLLLASGSYDATIKLWNVQTGQFLRTLESHTRLQANWSLEQSLAGILEGKNVGTPANSVNSVALSKLGTTLASGSADQIIKLWNTRNGKLLHTLKGHSQPVNSVALSADGLILASGSDDQIIKLWNAQTGQFLHTLQGHTGTVSSVALSADGLLLASGSWDHTIKFWGVRE